MKKLLTIVVILLVVVAGVVLGVMQPWKKGEDNQNPKTELENGELASAKGTKNDGDTPKTTASNNFPNERKKPRMMQSPTRASLSNPSKGGPSNGILPRGFTRAHRFRAHPVLQVVSGNPAEDNFFLFNGDFVDRGSYGVECFLALLCWKLLARLNLSRKFYSFSSGYVWRIDRPDQ